MVDKPSNIPREQQHYQGEDTGNQKGEGTVNQTAPGAK